MTNTNITVYIEPADGQKFELQVPLGMNIMRAAVEAGVRGIVGEWRRHDVWNLSCLYR
jgi:hypothetical protein